MGALGVFDGFVLLWVFVWGQQFPLPEVEMKSFRKYFS